MMKQMRNLFAASLGLVAASFAPAQAATGGDDCANIGGLRMLSDSAATITAGVLGSGPVLSRETIRTARDSARLAAAGNGLSDNVGLADGIAQAVIEIGDAMLDGDWLTARAMASDPEFQAGAREVQGYVNSRCSDAKGGGDATAGQGEGGDAPVRSLGGAEGIGDPTRLFLAQSVPVQFAGLLALIAALMAVAHGLRFAYDVAFAMIFRRIACFIPCTLYFERPGAEPLGGRVTILDRRGVGFEPNLLPEAAFVANADFYEPCRMKIGKREFKLRLLLYYPERMAFDFDAPLSFAMHRTLLGLTMVPASLSVRPPIDKEKARQVMERRKANAAGDETDVDPAPGPVAAATAEARAAAESEAAKRVNGPLNPEPGRTRVVKGQSAAMGLRPRRPELSLA